MSEEVRKDLEEMPKKRKRRLRMRIILFLLLFSLIAGGVLLLLLHKVFVVKEVRVQETSLYPAAEIARAAALEEGTPLVRLKKDEIASRVESAFDFIANVQVEYDLPGTVLISFEEARGEFCVRIGSENFAVAGDLSVLASGIPEEDGRITLLCRGIATCVVGEKMTFSDTGLQEMIPRITGALEEKGMRENVEELDLRDKFNIKMDYLGRFRVTVGEIDSLEYKLEMLKKVVEEIDKKPLLEGQEKATGSIDLTDPNTAYYNEN